ncbi:MAG: Smr/MutS family endonuclease [Gammaproteobacteria bacterium]|nr:Smr/MutS family endonuclease [Gammaproteobacteria bacterium]MCW8909880.1 Smr/MutS family endonuclease [Gammaproteobacteria bacterium]MCW9005094.1 Smr/MutS family endonuclease [Gammaproteobacteria bacterium]MCW9055612.1 Smr/MutS family endonuclease [Gammaproteobacteria bacterium]
MSDSNYEDDFDLFKQAMAGVTPIEHDKTPVHKEARPITRRTVIQDDSIDDTLSDDFVPDCGDYLEFIRPGVQKSLIKQIRNGKLPIEHHIDLHGQTRDQARKKLLAFIKSAQQNHYKLVCVVHGKGYNSEDGRPVLKALVNKWLQNIEGILAFTTAQPKDGGTGAVYVLIKRIKSND